MVSIKIAKSAAHDVSELTLKQAPARLLTLLTAVATDADIAQQFRDELSWSPQREAEGWALFNELKAASIAPAPAIVNPAKLAIAACEAWQSTGLVRARTMLEATHPEQALFLFHDFVPGKGMEAVANVDTFLQRRSILAHGAERKARRKADADALAIVEAAGTTKQKLDELAHTVHAAQSAAASVPLESSSNDADTARLEALRKTHAWVTMWSELARTVVTRRAQMIRLGIAKRRAKSKAVVVPPVTPITPPALPPTPAADDNGPESRAA